MGRLTATDRLRQHRLWYHWFVLGFCTVNLIFFSLVDPFRTDGTELLDNRDFSQGLMAWELDGAAASVRIEEGVLSIDHGAEVLSTTLSQCRPAQDFPDRLILSAESMSRSVIRGDASWHEARIDLVGYDTRGEGIYRTKTRLLSMDGDRDWRFARKPFNRPETADIRCVEISLYSSPGLFQVRHLSLQRGVKVKAFEWGRGLLLIGWVVLGLWMGQRAFRYYRERTQGRYLLLVLPLVIAGIVMPNEIRLLIERQFLTFLSFAGFESAPVGLLRDGSAWRLWPEVWDLSKVSHLLGFMLLGTILFSGKGGDALRVFLGLLLLALSTELLQFFVPDRTPRLSDLVVDTLGIALGWLSVVALRWLYRGRISA
ncbi:MAG: VanZ family protein [Candidatus Thiodiazotropha sp. (ex Monitilora ramsayi)]|nr:VanZ family protein [Candidatus Thiodiazotropha sp. (ex Monitilora ramsayi)]